MKEQIYQAMSRTNCNFIFLSGKRNANPVLNYLVPAIHMFDIFMVLRREDKPLILYNDMERDEAQSTGFEMLNYNQLHHYGFQARTGNEIDRRCSLYGAMFNALKVQGKVLFHVIGDVSLFHLVFQRLEKEWPSIEFSFELSDDFFTIARMTKEADEIEALRQAGLKTMKVYEATELFFRSLYQKNGVVVDQEGQAVSIGQVKQFIDLEAARQGLILGMDTIFSQGRDAGVPHSTGKADEVMRVGQSIVFDFFPQDKKSGYKFDMTRSYCLGHAAPHLQKAYADIKEAISLVEGAIKVGDRMSSLHHLVCDHFERLGYPTGRSTPGTLTGFTHGLGHGIGVEVHEAPSLSQFSDIALAPGMTFTVEPGLYFPDDGWGLRLEDILVVHHDGAIENLTTHPKEFVIPLKE